MKSIKSLLPYLKGKWVWMLAYATSNFLSVIFSTLSLVMIIPFLNMLFEKNMEVLQNPGLHMSKEGISEYFKYQLSHFIQSHGGDKVYGLIFICIILVSATFLKNLFLYMAKYMLHPLRNGVVRKIRSDVYAKMLHLPIGFFSNERKGDLMSRITNDVNAVETSIISLMELLFSTPFTVIFYFLLLLTLSAKLFLFLLVLLPIAGIIIGRVSKSLKKNTRNTQERLGNILSIVEETLGGIRIVKAYRAEASRQAIFDIENDKIKNLNNHIAARRELASPMSEFLGITILSIIIWFGGKMALSNPPELEPGTFILFISSFYFLINPLKALSQIFYNLNMGRAGLERIQEILHIKNTLNDSDKAIEKNDFLQCIEIKNVSFKYNDTPILENINLTISKGKTLAIVGSSGAGKSTLVDLIPRFHEVTNGEISIDQIPIQKLRLDSLRNLMGIVSQEPILFNDSIRNNVALGSHHIDDEKVWDALRIANADTMVRNKENALDEVVGDRGVKLSGGEKQRITIARAIYKNPPILILDEATSSLDTVSEKQVQEALDQLMKNRTTIVIAHRLSTVQNADEIIVLDKGKIIERGSHKELMQKESAYKKLVLMQQLVQDV